MERLLDIDPLSGAVETFAYDEMADTAVVHRRSADLQPLIDANKAMANHHVPPKAAPGELDMRLAARIPIDVVYLWLRQYGVRAWDKNHWPAVRRLLNDNEWRYLRTSGVII